MAEPIDIQFLKQYCRITSDAEDDVLVVFIAAARQAAEGYTKGYFVSQRATKSYPANQTPDVPLSAITAVTGWITAVADIPTSDSAWVQYLKGVTVNRDLPIDPFNPPKYTITYDVTVDPASVGADVQMAIASIAATLYENRENTHVNPIGPAARVLLAKYRKG